MCGVNIKEEVKKLLARYSREQIIIGRHSQDRASARWITQEVIIENILNPDCLLYAREQKANGPYERKFECFFGRSTIPFHRYIIVLNKRVFVCSVMERYRKLRDEQ